MIEMRQKRLVILTFKQSESEKIIDYITQNMYFMKNHCLAFEFRIDSKLRKFLREKNLDYFCVKNSEIFEKTQDAIYKDVIYQNTIYKDSSFANLAPQSPIFENLNNENQSIRILPKKIKISLDIESSEIVTNMTELDSSNIKNAMHSDKNLKDTASASEIADSKNSNISNNISQDVIESKIYGNNVTYSSALPSLVFNRFIRSGEVLDLNANATFLKNINADSVIKITGNLQIYANCYGNIESFGDFIIIKNFHGARISMKNIDLDKKMLDSLKDSKLRILSVAGVAGKNIEVGEL